MNTRTEAQEFSIFIYTGFCHSIHYIFSLHNVHKCINTTIFVYVTQLKCDNLHSFTETITRLNSTMQKHKTHLNIYILVKDRERSLS